MKNILQRSSVTLSTLAFAVSPLAAQRMCEVSRATAPGAAFGITYYDCASCSFQLIPDSTHAVYSYGTEPVVLATAPGSMVHPGDVIVAVNRSPITTRAGADEFAYPTTDAIVLALRRGGQTLDLPMARPRAGWASNFPYNTTLAISAGDSVSRPCDGFVERRNVGFGAGGSGGGRGGGRGGAMIGGAGGRSSAGTRDEVVAYDSGYRAGVNAFLTSCRMILARTDTAGTRGTALRRNCSDTMSFTVQKPIVSSSGGSGSIRGVGGGMLASTNVIESTAPQLDLKNFALTLLCHPACTRSRAHDGTTYWKFDGYPGVSAPAPGGLAAHAGLHEGDVLISVNGLSPMTEDGALLLNRSDKELKLNLEVSRAGKREKVVLKL